MQYRIQNIVFPKNAKHRQCEELFYRGGCGFVNEEEDSFSFGYGQRCDFVTYLNACSFAGWKRYTRAERLTVQLKITGDCRIDFVGYHAEVNSPVRTEYGSVRHTGTEPVSFTFPDQAETMLGFELTGMGECTLHEGYFFVEIQEDALREVVLSLATTTFRKENDLIGNVRLIQQEILNTDEEMRNHIYLHVVDNARTLRDSDVSGFHTFLHPNPNLGGAGGFSRGMYESLHQDPEATHVLLMDDDVLVLPESIRRIFRLLRILRPEYDEHFIEGAMLYYEKPWKQHEDIGIVGEKCLSFKPEYDHRDIMANLGNEQPLPEKQHVFGAWWCCCIPSPVIRRNGYALPVFIRLDDAEYSLRCRARFITMNGICIWHRGFETKYDNALVFYHSLRNELTIRAASDVYPQRNMEKVFGRMFRFELCSFNYGGAELVCRAVEDYLKGPAFYENEDLFGRLQEASALNEDLHAVDEFPEAPDAVDWYSCYNRIPRRFADKLWFHLTDNGHRRFPGLNREKGVALIPVDFSAESAQKMTGCRELIAVNPYLGRAVRRKMDPARYREISRHYRQILKAYRKRNAEVVERYREAFSSLVSEDSWVKRFNDA